MKTYGHMWTAVHNRAVSQAAKTKQKGHMTTIAAKHPAQALRARVVTGESFVPRTTGELGFGLSAWLSTIDVAGMGRE
jgi:hypothetical protein